MGQIITGKDHPGKYFADGVEYEKTPIEFGGSYTLYAPEGSHFVETGTHILGWAGDTYKEMRVFSKDFTLAKCAGLDADGYCDGETH